MLRRRVGQRRCHIECRRSRVVASGIFDERDVLAGIGSVESVLSGILRLNHADAPGIIRHITGDRSCALVIKSTCDAGPVRVRDRRRESHSVCRATDLTFLLVHEGGPQRGLLGDAPLLHGVVGPGRVGFGDGDHGEIGQGDAGVDGGQRRAVPVGNATGQECARGGAGQVELGGEAGHVVHEGDAFTDDGYVGSAQTSVDS